MSAFGFPGFRLSRLLWRVLCHGARQAVWRTGRGDRHVESQAHVDYGLFFALSKAIHIHLPHRHGASVFWHWSRGLFEELKGNQSVGRTIAHARHSQLLHSNRTRRGTSVSKQPSLSAADRAKSLVADRFFPEFRNDNDAASSLPRTDVFCLCTQFVFPLFISRGDE